MMKYVVKKNPNTVFDEFFNDDFFFPRMNYGSHIDVYQKGNDYVVEVDLPGFKKEEISIEFNNDMLSITADHREEDVDENKKYYYRSRKSSSFRRQVRFNDVNASSIDANYTDGVLQVVLPMKDHQEVVNRIEVK